MKLAHIVFFCIIGLPIITLGSWWLYNKHNKKDSILLFKTTQPEKRTITRIIDASGLIKLKDTARLGSLVSGTVDEIMVEENTCVKAGQPLATINLKDKDFSYKVALERAKQSLASYEYQKSHTARMKKLFETQGISSDAMESELAKLQDLEATLSVQNMIVEQEKALYEQRILKSPIDGVVVAINVTKGEPITTDLQATVLFEVAPSISNMRAYLDIDESDITLAKPGQKIEISVDSQPSRIFNGKMQSVSYSPKGKSANIKYEGIVDILDGQELLRPGMTAHASVVVAREEDTLGVLSQAFFVNKKALEEVSKKLNYSFKPIPTKKTTADSNVDEKQTKNLWLFENNSFVEKEVEIGITDDTYYAVHSGLSEKDKVIIDVDEVNALDEFYKQISQR
ncbi:efflux RND transporter periplasmic adaptor subunit [Candidatus Dependentiae bacterium]|nr:efflux RND transporter periplasmic adaptor subunit [Candidatus Dependentiae bacterium]